MWAFFFRASNNLDSNLPCYNRKMVVNIDLARPISNQWWVSILMSRNVVNPKVRINFDVAGYCTLSNFLLWVPKYTCDNALFFSISSSIVTLEKSKMLLPIYCHFGEKQEILRPFHGHFNNKSKSCSILWLRKILTIPWQSPLHLSEYDSLTEHGFHP